MHLYRLDIRKAHYMAPQWSLSEKPTSAKAIGAEEMEEGEEILLWKEEIEEPKINELQFVPVLPLHCCLAKHRFQCSVKRFIYCFCTGWLLWQSQTCNDNILLLPQPTPNFHCLCAEKPNKSSVYPFLSLLPSSLPHLVLPPSSLLSHSLPLFL